MDETKTPLESTEMVEIGVESGKVGTTIFNGYISLDYNELWRTLSSRCTLVQQMVDSDATISAILSAIKDPIRSAKWFVEAASESPEDKEMAEFCSFMMFENLCGGFDNFLAEALTCLEYGFSLFEKIYTVKNGRIVIDRFAPRLQSSISRWNIGSEPWVDGHPTGITQQINGTDDTKTAESKGNGIAYNPTIPWNKLTRFTFRGSGHNYEGISILRPVYQHWFYKDLLYKIAAISAEKFGVGTPYAMVKGAMSSADKAELEDMLANMRSNEQGYAILGENVTKVGILTPEGSGNADQISMLIAHHDKKIYDSVLTGFLNLASGDGGSNALSRDLSSFFLRGEQAIVALICGVINEAFKEVIYLNFGVKKKYPVLRSSDIGDISLDESIAAIALAREKGLISWGDQDETKVRETLKLPSLSKVQDGSSPRLDANTTQQQGPQELPIIDSSNEDIMAGKAKTENIPKEKTMSLSEDGVNPDQQEAAFMRDIAAYENFIQGSYGRIEKFVSDVEKEIRDGVAEIYRDSEVERIDGVLKLKRSAKNNAQKAKAVELVKNKMKKIARVIFKNANNKNSGFVKTLFNKTRKMAVASVIRNESMYAETVGDEVDDVKFNGFLRGYLSNVEAFLDKEERQMLENIDANYSSQVAVDLAAQQAEGIAMNRNILKLSIITHPRGAYNAAQNDMHTAAGFTHYKILAPKAVVKNLDPAGMTAKVLFNIYTLPQLNKKIHEETDGKTVDVMNGLNLHHNAVTYAYPIASDQVEEEEQLARKQRKQLQEDLQD